MDFKSFYRSQNPEAVSVTKPTARKGLTMSPGNTHQNIIQKARNPGVQERSHPLVNSFIKLNLQKKDVTNNIQDILSSYDIDMIAPGEEKSINSNSEVRIRNENGRYFLVR